MHFGQMGFWQTRQCSVVRWFGCREQTGIAGSSAGVEEDAVSGTAPRRKAIRAGGAAGAAAGATSANCCRINPFTYSEESRPQAGQTKRIGFWTISWVTSKAYLAPHEHWIFTTRQSFGFNKITPCVTTSENAILGGVDWTDPSQNRKLPPAA